MNPNPEPEEQAPHHCETRLYAFGCHLLKLPCYSLTTAAFDIPGREGARDERWAPTPWSLSVVIVAVVTWLAVVAMVLT